MDVKIYVGQTIKVRSRIKDDNNALTTPSDVIMRVYPPIGDVVEVSLDEGSVYLVSTGRYIGYFDATEAGEWTAEVETLSYENQLEVRDIEQLSFTVYPVS
jgi:hypothetical protein